MGSTGSAGPAKDDTAAAILAAREFRKSRVVGRELSTSIDNVLKSMRWHETLRGARVSSASRGKPILWIQALGDLDGYC